MGWPRTAPRILFSQVFFVFSQKKSLTLLFIGLHFQLNALILKLAGGHYSVLSNSIFTAGTGRFVGAGVKDNRFIFFQVLHQIFFYNTERISIVGMDVENNNAWTSFNSVPLPSSIQYQVPETNVTVQKNFCSDRKNVFS